MIPFLHGALASNGAASAYELIESQTVGAGGSASITFTVPAGYQHIQVRGIARTNRAGATDYLAVQFNADTASNYNNHWLQGDGTSATSSNDGSATGRTIVQRITSAVNSANIFGAFVFDLLDYNSTSKNKTQRHLGGYDANGSGIVVMGSGLWFATPAVVTSVKFSPGGGTSLDQYSTFSLYGIKGA